MTVRIRAVCAAALAMPLVAVPMAVAKPAPRPPCRILVDTPGDSKAGASLDVVSADIGSTPAQVTAVLRVQDLNRSNPDAPTGQYWYLQWTVAGQPFPLYLGAVVTPVGAWFEYGHREGTLYRPDGAATGVIDEARGEVRITAPLTAWPGQIRKGTKLTKILADTYWFIGVAAGPGAGAGSLQPGDVGTTSATHTVGTPTCVAVGR